MKRTDCTRQLLPRYEVDNLFVADQFRQRFPEFRVTPFSEELARIREERAG